MPVKLNGSTSGYVELTAPAVAGTTTLTLPTTTGTLVVANGGQTLEFAAGTVSAPSITTTGDTNTGIYFPAADTTAITTGGTERMRVDSSGNVGIGTTSPGSYGKLTVAGSIYQTASQFLAQTDGTNTVYWSLAPFSIANSFGVGTAQAIPFIVGNSNLERMRIDTSGNVGIGTSSPGSKLHVSGTVTVKTGSNAYQAIVDGAVTTNSGYYGVWNSSAVRIGFTGYWDGTNFVAAHTDSTTPVTFGANGSERMRITSGGEVYIAGTTDQGAYNLQCNGTGVWGAGAYVNGSDARIKDDIAPIGSCLDIIASLNPVTFKYKEDWSRDQSVQPGFIAQELQAALGNTNYVDGVVMQGPEYMSVAYQSLIPVLTKALQEALTEINSLKARVAALENA